MNRTCIPLFLFIVIMFSCSPSASQDPAFVQKNKKYSIDSLINKDRGLTLMVKIKGRQTLLPMPADGKGVETVYNILRNKNGQVLYISEIPKSPDDEWFIAYKSYFDENGKLFAFQRQNNFFNSGCTKGAALESLVKYYNVEFEVVDSAYTLTDSYKKDLDKRSCKFPYNFPYKIYNSVEEYRQNVKGI